MADNANVQSPNPEAGSSPATAPATTCSEFAIDVARKAIAKHGGSLEWDQARHVSAIVYAALACGLPKASAKLLDGYLKFKGLGGNASQFRQWLETAPDKGPGILPPPTSRAAQIAGEY